MSQDARTTTIPLSKVVLYKHGIGYFERRGKVEGATRVEIKCQAEEIDDMLKSLLVLNIGGGRLAQVTYDCSKTLETRLEEFGFDIKDCRGLLDLVAQMKGTPVTIEASGERVSGRVIGLDATEYVVHDKVVHDQQLAIYTGDSNFRRFSLSSISAITVDDQSVAGEIRQQLELLFQGIRKKDTKMLAVCLEEDKAREVLLAYSIPCPIWKTSYRLVFSGDGKLFVQGTAIVDNVQDEDWTNVEMVLISASPISFIQPLYDPIQPYRRTIEAQGVTSAGPVVAERKQKDAPKQLKKLAGIQPAAAAPTFARAEYEETGAPGAWGGTGELAMCQSVSGAMVASADESLGVQGTESGEMFEYKVEMPVTVPRDSSALIPIVNQTIEGERISLYNESRNPRFPYATVRLENTTGLTLEAGPVTIMEDDAYAGEALLDVLKPNDTRFLPYALDQGCHVLVRTDNRRMPIWRVRTLHGYLYMDHRERVAKLYHLENLTNRAKRVYVEHPVRSDLKLVQPQNADEVTQNYYRFFLELAPSESRTLEVWEETEATRQLRLDDAQYLDVNQLTWLMSQNFLDRSFLDFLKQVIIKRNEIGELAETKRQVDAQVAQYKSDQERARENVKALGTTNERWRKAIDQTEDLIMDSTKMLQELNRKIEKKWREYAEMVRDELVLEVEEQAVGSE